MILQSHQIRTPQNPRKNIPPSNEGGKLRYIEFKLSVPADQNNGELHLLHMPSGKLRIVGILSRISMSFKEQVKVSLGWMKYKIPLSAWVESDYAGIDKVLKGEECSIGSQFPMRTFTVDSQDGFDIIMRVLGKLTTGDGVHGYVIYVRD
jgi:hypothetical protein